MGDVDVQPLAAVGQLAVTLELFLLAFGGVATVAGAAGGVALDDKQMADDTGDFGGDGVGTSTGHGFDDIEGTLHYAAVARAAVDEEVENGAGVRVLGGTLAPTAGVNMGNAEDRGGNEGKLVNATAVEMARV